jgi:hypothetical protein
MMALSAGQWAGRPGIVPVIGIIMDIIKVPEEDPAADTGSGCGTESKKWEHRYFIAGGPTCVCAAG